MIKLTRKDYEAILEFYKIDVSRMKPGEIKEKAEHILATKLCKCIKSVNKGDATEKRAIAICYDSVIRKKNLKTFRFKCKNGAQFLPQKGKALSAKRNTRKSTVRKVLLYK